MEGSMDHGMTRRTALGVLAVAASGAVTLRGAAAAEAPLGQNEPLDAALKRVFGGRTMKDGAGMIKLDIPLIAENGAVVPVSVEVNAPMTPQSYVKNIYIVADKNRIPIVTRVSLTPASGQAYMGANIRLGETTDVRAIVEQSDGTLFALTREVKVTVGGCGG
jgi:sulfur-oxidizing protein SoxY